MFQFRSLVLACALALVAAQDLSPAKHAKLGAQRDQLFSDLTTELEGQQAQLMTCLGGGAVTAGVQLAGDPIVASHYIATDNVLALLAVLVFFHVVTYAAMNGPRGLFPLAHGFPVTVTELDFANERVVLKNGSGCDMDMTGCKLVAVDEEGEEGEAFEFADDYVLVDGDEITVVSGCDEEVAESDDAEARPLDSRFNNLLHWSEESVWGKDGGEAVLYDSQGNVVHRFKASAAVYM